MIMCDRRCEPSELLQPRWSVNFLLKGFDHAQLVGTGCRRHQSTTPFMQTYAQKAQLVEVFCCQACYRSQQRPGVACHQICRGWWDFCDDVCLQKLDVYACDQKM